MAQATKIQGKQKKIDTVLSLKEKLEKTKAVFLTDYKGLTHKQLEELRRSLKKAEAELVIAKNRLIKIALSQTGTKVEEMEKALENPTAMMMAKGDAMAAIKVMADYIKANQLPTIKMGVFEGKTATPDDFKKLASLPGRDVLLATLAMRLQSPIYGLHYAMRWNLQKLVVALNNVKGKKPSN